MKVDLETSRALAQRYRTRNKECFQNALNVVTGASHGTHFGYVEGYAVSQHSLVVLHGWVERRGKVVEVTPTWLEDAERNAGVVQYFPGRSYTRRELCRALLEAKALPLCEDGGYAFMQSEFRQAYRAASVAAYGEETVRWMEQQQSQLREEGAA